MRIIKLSMDRHRKKFVVRIVGGVLFRYEARYDLTKNLELAGFEIDVFVDDALAPHVVVP